MKSNVKSLILCFGLLSATGCQSTENSEVFDKDRVRKEIESMLSEYHSAMKTGGLETEFDYLDQSKDFFWVPPGYTSTLNYDSIRNILMRSSKFVKSVDIEWETLQVFPLSNEIAIYSGIVKGKTILTSGEESPMRIIESGTLIKRADGWKLLSGQSTALE